MTKQETILFLDMDGVLANFSKGIEEGTGDINQMFEDRFFRKLEPMENNLAEKIEKLQKKVRVKILSKACVERSDYRFKRQVADKIYWLIRYAPTVEYQDIIIQAADESKGEILREFEGYNNLLLDDYSLNLVEWELAGGIGIKKAKRYKNERSFEQVHNLTELITLVEDVL